MADTLLVSLSGLQAQQRAMEVTSHNIANATTPGYTRQRAELRSKDPESIKPGQIGMGVDVSAIRRLADTLLDQRLRQSDGEAARQNALKDNLMATQQVFNEPGENGLSAAINQIFASIEDLSNNPESKAIRATAVQQVASFAESLAEVAGKLTEQRDDLKTGIADSLAKINVLTASIAQLNQTIRTQIKQGNNPNDLIDRRDQALRELGGYVDARVRIQADQTALVDVGGQPLVGPDTAQVLSLAESTDGTVGARNASGLGYEFTGGSLGALLDLHKNQIPAISDALDGLASTLARSINAIHAVGTSDSHFANSWTSDYAVPPAAIGANLDDSAVVQEKPGEVGIPESFLPKFTDASGALVARDLTINVYDTVTKTAVKSVIRWDPAVSGGSRTMDDLISAINTGRGGGFTLFPPGSAGIPGVSATKVRDEVGYRLQLQATSSTSSIDFSPALDLNPAAQAWTGTGTVTVSGTTTSALGAARLEAQVDAAGGAVRLSYRNPADGTQVILGAINIPGVGTATATFAGITMNVDAGTYRAGDRFAIPMSGTATGAQVLDAATGLVGTTTQTAQWNASDATVQFKGRYTGTLSDPTKPWSMAVLSTGIVGAKAGTAAPNNPPVVQFTYWTGAPGAAVRQTVTKTLDASLPAGTPIQLADGVYATVSAGSLTSAGRKLEVLVDGGPDQAGLLPALGINQLFKGGESAGTMAIASHLARDPAQLALALSRNEGDNANLKQLLDLRQKALFDGGKATIDDSYQSVLTDLASQIQQATRQGENQEALRASLERQREQTSGVSIDEEVGALILQQQAYSAAARVVSAARENIQTLLEILR